MNREAAKQILIVEDELKLAQLLADYLCDSSFEPHQLHRGDEVLGWLASHPCDLILLDLMLPGLDGLEVCKQIRQHSNIPIIMITARVEEIDRLLGLELGADDYICKPFSPREVVARVKAVIRRVVNQTSSNTNDIQLDGIRLDEEGFKVSKSGFQCELTKVEFYLFHAMFKQPGRIFSRDQLMDIIYDDRHVVSDRTIDSHIKKVRKKIASIGIEESAVHSVYGAGYKYE
ncbi:two component transcriptional regulator, winged helix family [Shewanella sediminis HAW-EB3]|uniref:Two component transcriptional regulator, winged helix family n=1 Tax=Shewanella sediminis (strain HAW-EB3) TaxID=425104 RepID=A8FWH4_SHESH|nr:response regulator [Shewanella sediminis]ABV37197.1 two component transcriptional regulator, winged helix family [Shewanella sediminis HAW-EB3]